LGKKHGRRNRGAQPADGLSILRRRHRSGMGPYANRVRRTIQEAAGFQNLLGNTIVLIRAKRFPRSTNCRHSKGAGFNLATIAGRRQKEIANRRRQKAVPVRQKYARAAAEEKEKLGLLGSWQGGEPTVSRGRPEKKGWSPRAAATPGVARRVLKPQLGIRLFGRRKGRARFVKIVGTSRAARFAPRRDQLFPVAADHDRQKAWKRRRIILTFMRFEPGGPKSHFGKNEKKKNLRLQALVAPRPDVRDSSADERTGRIPALAAGSHFIAKRLGGDAVREIGLGVVGPGARRNFWGQGSDPSTAATQLIHSGRWWAGRPGRHGLPDGCSTFGPGPRLVRGALGLADHLGQFVFEFRVGPGPALPRLRYHVVSADWFAGQTD